MSFSGKDIAKITGGRLCSDFEGKNFCIDSRKIEPGDIFLALPGENIDGHVFVAKALSNGASGAIVTYIPPKLDQNSPLVIVENVHEALLALAKYKRDNIEAKYIAITGSAGKTSTKEMLKFVLENSGKTFVTMGNYNNDLGVPICMASIPLDSEYVVLEAGMNNPGEIGYLSNLIRPDIAIITNIEPVHLWTFDNVAGIAVEKASIVDGMNPGGVAIINSASKEFQVLIQYLKNKNVTSIVVGPGYDCEILHYEIVGGEIQVKARIFDIIIDYKLNHTADQQVVNSLYPLIVAHYLGNDLEAASAAIFQFVPLKGRGEVTKLKNGQLLIDDSYNANPASLSAALENLTKYTGRKLVIMADMLELGDDSPVFHEQLYRPEIFAKFDGVITLGPMMKHLYARLPSNLQKGSFDNFSDLANNIFNLSKNYDVILVKGSKGTKLLNIIDILKE